MNSNDELRKVKRKQKEGFVLGFFGAGGLVSALILGLYNFFNQSKKEGSPMQKNKSDKGPESFEIMDKK